MTKAKRSPGPVPEFTNDDFIVIRTGANKNKLQPNGDLRAIIVRIIDSGGKATINQLNSHFGFETREKVRSLMYSKWLALKEKKHG
jgi:hypothetical protein